MRITNPSTYGSLVLSKKYSTEDMWERGILKVDNIYENLKIIWRKRHRKVPTS